MSSWSLERAKNQLSEVVRRALEHEPQFVTRGGRDAVVVLATADYERLVAPVNIVDFLRNSPLARAVANGDIPEDAFDRRPETMRQIDM
ncbi:MAG: type II toxin-antitoxin system Phd/YefM family antitoxin [Gemmatimonadaceae bacterium]|nr:type II toxin-antitoxin system Phd/YefM family antitoxin [Gemmatimonadaceae bacterium]